MNNEIAEFQNIAKGNKAKWPDQNHSGQPYKH